MEAEIKKKKPRGKPFNKGHIPVNKNKKGLQTAWNKGTKGLMNTWNKGTKGIMKPNKTTFKKGQVSWNKGKKAIKPAWNKGKKVPQISGANNWRWKGGISPLHEKIRGSLETKMWKRACFERDNYTCAKYGVRTGGLVVHHIHNFADFPELRFAIDNGITLSVKAHKEFHKIYGSHFNNKAQLEEFLNTK
jgi:hypothetical protein